MPHPLPPVASVRDFYAFEQHVATCRRHRGLEMVRQWYEVPVFYFSNPAGVVGHEVGSGVERLGKQPEAVGRESRAELDRDQRDRGEDGEERGPALRAHAGKRKRIAARDTPRDVSVTVIPRCQALHQSVTMFPQPQAAPRAESAGRRVQKVRGCSERAVPGSGSCAGPGTRPSETCPGDCPQDMAAPDMPRAFADPDYRFPLSACSRSIASKSALKFPSPKPRAPWRSITSKKSVGRSCAVFVKIWSR